MYKGTLGCMYECGDFCIGRCNREEISVADESRKDLYREIESLIIFWSNDGNRTAGSLTREIMDLLDSKGRGDSKNE